MADPGFQVVVTSNAADVAHWMDDLARKQIPFATAVALTRVAQYGQAKLKGNLKKHFTIRNERVPHGIRIKRAEKRDWPHCVAFVGSVDNFMRNQATGEPKRASKTRHIAIPSRVAIGTRTTTGRIPAQLKPKPLIASGNGFVTASIGDMHETIYRRVEKVRSRLKNLGIVRFFRLVDSQPMKRRWPIQEEVSAAALGSYGPVFKAELAKAIESAHVRGQAKGQAALAGAVRSALGTLARGV
jgi:hypothetical protein